jgi:thiamine pyrophosphokinase
MDSLLPEVEKHYSSLGTLIHKDLDQYSTDLTKCLRYISDNSFQISQRRRAKPLIANQSEIIFFDIVIVGGLGGRADQAFSQLHQLYATNEALSTRCGDLYLVTPESILFLLAKGLNSIKCPVGPKLLTKYVGIIPIGGPSILTTRGLEWDVTSWITDFGTQVSTSNHIVKDIVEIETSERVLFTVGISLE